MLITCPHCKETRFIEQINCGIFRDGVFKSNLQQIPPHLSQYECDKIYEEGLIIGCGKPFRVYLDNTTYKVEICDYI